MNYKMKCEYDGTNYVGFQIQPNAKTIQGEIEKALHKLAGEHVSIVGSGRTDAGVHALGQVINFELNKDIPCKKLHIILNRDLPDDIKLGEAEIVNDNFNSRKTAKKKTYVYRIYTGDRICPTKDRYAVHCNRTLNISNMKKASKILVGKHDFSAFKNANCEAVNFIRIIYSIKIEKINNDISFTITGNGFLYNMVRIIVGTLIMVGSNELSKNELEQILKSKDRKNAGKTMPARGLTLVNVEY